MSWQSSAGVIWMKVYTTLYRRLNYLVRDLSKPIPVLRSELPVEMRRLRESEIRGYLRFKPGQSEAQIHSRLASGHECHASWYEGQIIDAAWCSTTRGPVAWFGRDIIVREGEVYIYDAYTSPECRGRNLFMAKFAHIFRVYQDASLERANGLVAPGNRTSMAVMLRLGCEVVGHYKSIGIGPWRSVWKGEGGKKIPSMVRPSKFQ
jgi:hypothetical protein